ncbi:DUF551 domain-containing protein [Klebsiella pneumoniae]|nr:DUF551 domain-containing protein [Klebsiella pneumoniae]
MRHIFTPTGMTNVSDMQAVFDRVEAVLVGMDQPAPVVPDGYVMVPMRLTAENGAKGALSGEFSETKFVNCPECFGDDECETCDGSGRIEITVPVTWTTIKEIWAKGVEHFAAAPQSPGGDHATVPGKWIPVSERMPDDEQEVLTINKMGHRFVSFFDKHSGLFFDRLDAPAACCIEHVLVTHWMPLPAAPQEVNRE